MFTFYAGYPPRLYLVKIGANLSAHRKEKKISWHGAGVNITDLNFWQGGLDMPAKYVELAKDLATKAG